MKVVYYTHTCFLEPALLFSRAISERIDLHLMLELSPWAWRCSMFDMTPVNLPSGVFPAHPVLSPHFDSRVTSYWSNVASFDLVSHASRKSIHPAAWWTSRQVAQYIHQIKPDVLHIDDSDMSLRLGLDMFELRDIPVVLNVHDPEPHSGERDWRKAVARKMIFPFVDQFVLHNSRQVDVFCRDNKIDLDRVSVTYLGSYEIYREWIEEPILPDERTVLFFGRLSPYKGVDVLYRAIQLVAEIIPHVHLIVAGSGGRAYVPPAPPALANGGSIKLINGYVTNDQLAELFQMSTAVVCPYVDATQSGVVLTAYAFDRPVISTSVGGLPEYVLQGESGFVVPPNDSGALADALVKILSDPDLRACFARKIRALKADRLSWETVAQHTIGIYEMVRSRRPY